MAFHVTTAIPYVNAAPHLGHVLELVQADVLARHRRLRGDKVNFLTGTDENALKNVTAAAAAGTDVAAFVAANAARFAGLAGPLSLSFDDFIRTSGDARHREGVQRLWRASAARGDFYRRDWTGWYCAGCEQFSDRPGRCPEHGAALDEVTETNWFFRLSRYAARIEGALDEIRIEPEARRNEVLSFVRSGLTDISVSRPAARAGGWGIPVPDDPDQVVYVWWDALANYLTADPQGWQDATERVHVIGKGIVRFHAVYWPALLLSTGHPLPTAILVHDYLTVDGRKISKSAGTAIDPYELVARYGDDALRWWLLSEVARVGDTDFTEERLRARYHQDLANGLGNLVSRTAALVRRHPVPDSGEPLGADLPERIDRALAAFDLRAATGAITDVVTEANRFVERERPWEVADPYPVLARLAATCRLLARELTPFLPSGATRIAAAEPGPVFPRFR